MDQGLDVEVRSRFDGRWVGGFEVVDVRPAAAGEAEVWVRRRSDGTRLPLPFAAGDVRPRAGSLAAPVMRSQAG